MRNQALEFLANLPEQAHIQFNRALDIYRKSAGHSERQLKHFNLGYSAARLMSLLYELKKLHKITEKDIKLYVPAGEVAASGESAPEATGDNLVIVGAGPAGTTVITTKDEVFTKASDEVKTEIKLRDEFPFLKDADCPDEFKILIADKFTHYDNYVEAHSALLTIVPEEGQEPVAMTDEQIFELAKAAVESFTMNQEIYDELLCFKNTGKILGKHPIFKDKILKDKVAGMSNQELTKRQSNLVNYINRTKNNLKEAVNEKAVANLTQKLEDFQKEKELVDAQIVANDKK